MTNRPDGGMDRTPSVDILLSTYNGAAYLRELLESLKAQTYPGWTLIARDDGSGDDTAGILRGFADARVRLIEDGKKRLGPSRSFGALLKYSTAPYVMFCDQDDVWMRGKIELTMKKMLEAESRHAGAPVLVHTDMSVTDAGSKIIARSFWRYQRLDPKAVSLNGLLMQNVATGCTIMMNGKLRELISVPDEASMHDWWAALVASAFGRIEAVDEPTVFYRQHGKNAVGAVSYPFGYFAARITNIERSKVLLRGAIGQAEAFLAAYGDRLSEKDRLMVSDFANLLRMGRLRRARTFLRHGFSSCGLLRKAGKFALLITTRAVKD